MRSTRCCAAPPRHRAEHEREADAFSDRRERLGQDVSQADRLLQQRGKFANDGVVPVGGKLHLVADTRLGQQADIVEPVELLE